MLGSDGTHISFRVPVARCMWEWLRLVLSGVKWPCHLRPLGVRSLAGIGDPRAWLLGGRGVGRVLS
jgi:hypothetical protein